MDTNFQRALARVLVYEGGKVNNPNDPGGKTNQGVTQRTYNAWLRAQGKMPLDVYNIPDVDRDTIYRTQYWDTIQGDKLPSGVDLAVFDAAVNSGPSQAVKWLQAALNDPGVTADGVLGVKTMDVIAAVGTEHDLDTLIENICSHRLATLQRLSTWKYFGPGWHARVANVQKTALSWEDAAPVPMAPDLSGLNGSAKANVANIKPPVVSQIAAHMTTAATGAGTVASQAASQVQGLQDTFSWVKYVFGGLTLLGVAAGVIAMVATKAQAAALAGTSTATVDLQADAALPALPDVKVAAPASVKGT
jgi:lysozyme family protein